MAVPANIVFGDGVFSVNGVDVALTRGGGQFLIENEYRSIPADGDYGDVKDRIRIIGQKAKIKFNSLELLPSNIAKFYPSMNRSTADSTKDVITGTLDISIVDYSTVTWTGKTKAGKAVVITLYNAINLENLDWSLVDKEEVVPELTFTATYNENTRKSPPWQIEFFNTDAVAPVAILAAPKAGAATQLVVSFNEALAASTLAITDRFNLLSSLSNDALGTPVAIAITTLANSVTWIDANTTNPKAVITIASTTFVAGKTVRLNFKASAVGDISTPTNYIAAATNFDAVVTA